MIRSSGLILLLAITALGCQRENVRQEQQQDQRELARAQNAERQELARAQAAERAAGREEAREDLGDRAEAVQEERQDLNEARRDLAASITAACEGVATPDACPIPNDSLRSSSNSDHGVTIVLAADTGTRAEVQRRIDCYRARATLRGTPVAGACIIDLADQNVTANVQEDDGHVTVDLTSTDDSWVTRVRNEARQLLASITPRRNAGTARN